MSKRHQLERLRQSAPAVLPSLLMCDFGNLEREMAHLTEAGVKALHLDVMDGNFVPNLTYGMPVVAAVRRLTDMPLDVHLMINHPAQYVDEFCEAGADSITFHVEAQGDPREVLARIREYGVAAGVALNPETPLETITPYLDLCDLVLVMSVKAGFGGQAFNPLALDKLRAVRELAPDVLREVDGGVNEQTIAKCANAGAQLFVVGSAIFNHERYAPIVAELTELAEAR
jgi:ribulose-phosphate 3-epimerase